MASARKCPTCGADLATDAEGRHCLRCLLSLALTPEEPQAASGDAPDFEGPGDQIGPYKLLYQIGEGGCGIVYLAEQEQPVTRHVALKVIKLGMDTKSVIARFEAERQAMALMDHPNIAMVLDAGSTRSGRPFFVMELVRGVKITEFCDRNNLSTRERLALFVQVCQAIQHAHQKGVIHRDIKPSNILVTLSNGAPESKVIDFGIAKATQQPLTDKTLFTAYEQFLGTPAYMSPEQADMNSAGVDTRSDIYSLGVLLYELLTGQTPFDTATLLEGGFEGIRRTIREREPERPSARLSRLAAGDLAAAADRRQTEGAKLVGAVRGDLDWIVMKALEKERARRYETANGLALDIRRHLDDEPVAASPPGNFYRLQKLVRRNKLVFAAGTMIVLALAIGFAVATWQYLAKSRAEREQGRLRREAQTAEQDEARLRRQSQMQELEARRKAYAASMNLLQRSLAEDNLGRAMDLLNQQRPGPSQEDLRGWEWRYLWQFCHSEAKATVCTQSNAVMGLSFSDDGSLAVAAEDGAYSLWELAGMRMVFHDEATNKDFYRVSFARGENWLVYGGTSNVVVWDSRKREVISRLPSSRGFMDATFITGNRLVVSSRNEPDNIAVWNVTNCTREMAFTAPIFVHGVGVRFTCSSDGKAIAFAISNRVVRVVDLAQGTNHWDITAAEELTTAMAFSPDGTMLATGGGYTESGIKLWDVKNRKFLGELKGNRSWVEYLKFAPDGTLASAGADKTVRLWDVEEQRLMRTLRGHHAEIRVLDISPDGRTLASGDKEGTVLLWDLAKTKETSPEWQTIDSQNHPGNVTSFAFSPDSRIIAAQEDNTVKLYDSATLVPLRTLELGLQRIDPKMLFSPDARLLAVASTNGQVAVWDLFADHLVTNFLASPKGGALLGSSFLNDGACMLTWGYDGLARAWGTTQWRMTAQWPLTGGAAIEHNPYTASSTNGHVAFYQSHGAVMQLFDSQKPGETRMLECPAYTSGIALSPDGRTVAASCEDGTLTLWDTQTLRREATMRSVLLGLHSVAFSPDGKRIAAGSNGEEAVKIWDAVSHEDLLTLSGRGSLFRDTSFSPDGNMIVACGWSGILHVWRAPSWPQIEDAEHARQSGDK